MLIEEKPNGVECLMPTSLYRTIVRIQAARNLGWTAACQSAGSILNEKEADFERRIGSQAEKLYNSRFMTQLNKAKKQTFGEGYKAGVKAATLKVPHAVCGQVVEWDPTNESTRAVLMKILAGGGYSHSGCKKASP